MDFLSLWQSFLYVYNKRHYFDFDIVNFPVLDGDTPRPTSYGAYLESFASREWYLTVVILTPKIPKQGYHVLV